MKDIAPNGFDCDHCPNWDPVIGCKLNIDLIGSEQCIYDEYEPCKTKQIHR